MAKIKQILRCYATGISIKGISDVFFMSRNTIRRYVRMFQDSGKSIDDLMRLSEHHLQEMFGSSGTRERVQSERRIELEALLPEYAARLSRKGVTIKSLYEEYSKLHPNGYRLSSFDNSIRRQRLKSRAIGHVEHYAGDQMYIDYAGDKLEIVDANTGKTKSVEV